MLIEALQTYLTADAGLRIQLGTAASRSDHTTGIFPMIAPGQVPMPYVVLQQVSGAPLQTSLAGTGRLQTSRWRFSAYGTTYKNAKLLAQALRDALNSFAGYFEPQAVQIQGSWLKLEADDFEEATHATIYASHVDYEIVYLDLE